MYVCRDKLVEFLVGYRANPASDEHPSSINDESFRETRDPVFNGDFPCGVFGVEVRHPDLV